jgi:hypothetical protein
MAHGPQLKLAQLATWLRDSNVDPLGVEGVEMVKDKSVTLASSGCR